MLNQKEINQYVFDQTVIYLDLVAELCKSYAIHQLEDQDEMQNPFKPVFEQVYIFINELLD